MRKRLAIIAVSLNYASFLHNQLKQLFKDNIEIIAYSYEVEPISRLIDADLYIITVSSLYHLTKKFIPKEKKVIIPSHTITKSQYDQIMNIPAGTSVMVVNDNYESTIQTITLFHNLEINHLDFVPYYTGMKNIPDLDIAITRILFMVMILIVSTIAMLCGNYIIRNVLNVPEEYLRSSLPIQ